VKPRYYEGNPHEPLFTIINKNKKQYEGVLKAMIQCAHELHRIPLSTENPGPMEPAWNNGFLPGLDIAALYTIIIRQKPLNYIEIGSGNSTKVVAKATREHSLKTQIISIDPYPRAEIDALADRVIRMPLEHLEDVGFIADMLGPGDVLFIDNSHHVFPNSDAMVCFMEILPRLKKGVVVHVHDIYLPYDYPQFMCDRYYNEQYTLAAFLMAAPDRYQTVFPAFYVSLDPELRMVYKPLFDHHGMQTVENHGCSFWFTIGTDPH
jgi:predicted O-methyltransferase YrrM